MSYILSDARFNTSGAPVKLGPFAARLALPVAPGTEDGLTLTPWVVKRARLKETIGSFEGGHNVGCRKPKGEA